MMSAELTCTPKRLVSKHAVFALLIQANAELCRRCADKAHVSGMHLHTVKQKQAPQVDGLQT